MIDIKYNPDTNGKTKVILEFDSNDNRSFGAIFSKSLLGIGAKSNGSIETPNLDHIRRIYSIHSNGDNVCIDSNSLIAVGAISD